MDVRVVSAADFGGASCDAFLSALPEGEANVGLPSGATPLALYEGLRRRVEGGSLSEGRIRRIHPWAIDEYVSERPHACDNRNYFRQQWEPLPGAWPVEGFDGAAGDLLAEAGRYLNALEEAGGLDTAVLGIGLNGHIGFNEPGSDPFGRGGLVALAPASRDAARPCWGDRPPSQGLTLGLGTILAAERIVLLANGAHKAAVVFGALMGPVGPACPASYLQEHESLVVVLDQAAAIGLRGRLGGAV